MTDSDAGQSPELQLARYLDGYTDGALFSESRHDLSAYPEAYRLGFQDGSRAFQLAEQRERERLFGAPVCPKCGKSDCFGHD